jgi:hypothetical protein
MMEIVLRTSHTYEERISVVGLSEKTVQLLLCEANAR